MAIDPNIALGVRPIEIASPLAQYGQVAQIQNAQNQNALAQYQLGSAQRQESTQNALSDAYKAAYNPETGAIDNTKLMRGLAERGAGHLIPDVQTKMLATQEKQGAIKKTAVETTGLEFKQRIDKATKAIGDIAALNNPEEAMASIDQHLANGDIDKQKADMLKGQLSQAPSFGAWQKGMLVNILDAKERLTQTSPKPMQVTRADGSIIFLDQNPNSPTFQKEIMPAQASGMTPYQIEQNKIAKQNAEIAAGQLGVSQGRLGVERQRVGLEGQRVNIARQESERKMQGLEALPPKEIQKREAVFPQATAAVKGFENKSTSFVNDLIALRDDPGLEQITGAIYGRTPSVSREGSRAQALYDKIVAKGGFQALQDMRDASKTGGALGNISNQEGKQLTASFAAIDRRQDAKDVKAAIDQAIADIEGSKVRMREAYDSTYNYKFGAPAANVVTNPKFPGFSVGKP